MLRPTTIWQHFAICLSYANFIETCRKQTHAQTYSVISYLSQSHVWLTCYPLRLRTVWLWINRTEMSTSWPCKVAGSCQGSPGSHRTSGSQGSPKKTQNGRSKAPSNKGPLAHTHSMPGILCCFSSGIAGCHRFLTIRLLAHLKQISPRTPEWHQNGRRHVKYVKPLSTPKPQLWQVLCRGRPVAMYFDPQPGCCISEHWHRKNTWHSAKDIWRYRTWLWHTPLWSVKKNCQHPIQPELSKASHTGSMASHRWGFRRASQDATLSLTI